jgi:hypothetical protein
MTAHPRQQLLELMPRHSVCAEIGVWKGDFSQAILDVAQPRALHLIDPWVFTTAYGKRWYGGGSASNQQDMDVIYQDVCSRFQHLPGVTIHRSTSSRQADLFPDGYFDWVYVDGNHYYEFVLDDLTRYLPKVRPGGYLTGDDFYWSSIELEGDQPVRRAVEDFVGRTGLTVRLIHSQYVISVPSDTMQT